jgi:hypothetical protein
MLFLKLSKGNACQLAGFCDLMISCCAVILGEYNINIKYMLGSAAFLYHVSLVKSNEKAIKTEGIRTI